MIAKQYKNRRFVMFGDMGNIKQYVLDKKENKRFDSKWALMDKLNELAEENEQLKKRNGRLEEKIQRERTSFAKTHERWSKEAENKIKELSDENEQLKTELTELKASKEDNYNIDDGLW